MYLWRALWRCISFMHDVCCLPTHIMFSSMREQKQEEGQCCLCAYLTLSWFLHLFNDACSITDYTASNNRMIYELEWMWKKVVVVVIA